MVVTGLSLEVEGLLLEAGWILSAECQRTSPVLPCKGSREGQEGRLEGRPRPVIQGLTCHPEGFGLYLRAKVVLSEFLKMGSKLFIARERGFFFPKKEAATLISTPSPGIS